MSMKVYQVYGQIVTLGNEDRKFYDDVVLDIFLNKEDAEKSKDFYSNFTNEFEWFEGIDIAEVPIYKSYEDFKSDMEGN